MAASANNGSWIRQNSAEERGGSWIRQNSAVGAEINDDLNSGEFNKRVVTAEDVYEALNGNRVFTISANTIVTPLAKDRIKELGLQVRIATGKLKGIGALWAFSQEWENGYVQGAINVLSREGIEFQEIPRGSKDTGNWAKELGTTITAGQCKGAAVFCREPGIFCCVANKIPGIRGVAIASVLQAAKATFELGANLIAVEIPGRTYYEIRSILNLVATGDSCCPAKLRMTLQELDGHAHS